LSWFCRPLWQQPSVVDRFGDVNVDVA